jgi:hypothetical protein
MKVENVYIDASQEDELVIYVQYDNGEKEEIDTALDMDEAATLQYEYQLAYGVK